MSISTIRPDDAIDDRPTVCRNHILASLADDERERLFPSLERVELTAKQVLSHSGHPPPYLYFPEGGVLSFTLELPQSGLVEFGIVGREGMSSFAAFRPRGRTPVRTIVQVGGAAAYRTTAEEGRAAFDTSPVLRAQIFNFLYHFMGQMALTAVSNARHGLSARLSRWLLLCHDRLDGDEVPLTHEFMAIMLGAQRTSVTLTLHILEGDGAIRSCRGMVRILDRAKLEAAAGEAYVLPAALSSLID